MYRKGDDVYYTPDELGYRDRGMVKWQGFILSDHMEQRLAEEREQRYSPPRLELSQEDCAARLKEAYEERREVALQLNQLEDGHYRSELVGRVRGVQEGQLYLETATGLRHISLDLIRHVRLRDSAKWFQQDAEQL